MYVVAEVGCNHKGDLDIAKRMIESAAHFCNVDAVKFQKRCIEECLTLEQRISPHPNPENSYGQTYGEHRESLEFSMHEHELLREHCEKHGVHYGCSVWDHKSLKEIVSIQPDFIKFPSAWNLDKSALEYAFLNSGSVHISTGMTTDSERESLFAMISDWCDIAVVYACTSGYPVDFEDLHLLEIQKLKNRGVKVGYSGHHLGIAVDIAAMTLGAEYIERHFTLNRTWKGTDHAASLEPDGMRRLVRDLHSVKQALTYKIAMPVVEVVQREKLKRC